MKHDDWLNSGLSVMTLLTVLILAQFPALAGQQPLRVYDKGQSDGARYYRVICEDERRVGVRQMLDIPQVEGSEDIAKKREAGQQVVAMHNTQVKQLEICAEPYSGLPVCKQNWSVDEAAHFACDSP